MNMLKSETLTLHYCTYVVVEDLHQLLSPSVHVHGCAELLGHCRKTCNNCAAHFLGCLEGKQCQEKRTILTSNGPQLVRTGSVSFK